MGAQASDTRQQIVDRSPASPRPATEDQKKLMSFDLRCCRTPKQRAWSSVRFMAQLPIWSWVLGAPSPSSAISRRPVCCRSSIRVFEMGAGPAPVFWCRTQARFDWVLMNVADGLGKMLAIADVAIPVFPHP